ncbi:MAG TPA: adenylate/guanylate cyclase domain-containing protein [Acidimicrobiia bacterium]|nr:adenylate/guanylate cyclase domain-containing protein [Acidimicrobiia bacterium]
MIAGPQVRFTRAGDVDLAYHVMGEGRRDIVLMIGWVSHIEVLWELPEARHFLERLAGMGRVVMFDKRGTGLSDRTSQPMSTADLVPDVLTVMDAVGMEKAVLVGWVDAAALAIEVAARHPERVEALVLGEILATAVPDPTHPWGADAQIIEALAEAIESGGWGEAILLPLIAPSVAGDERVLQWFKKLERMAATPSLAANLIRRTLTTDLRDLLPAVAAPTLVLHRRDAPFLPGEGVAWLARQVVDGRYAEVPGDEVPGYLGDVDALMDEIEEFLLGTRTGAAGDRRVTTVLFSDVVGSTERLAAIGDRRWHDLLETHRSEARTIVTRFGGREVDTAGDGFLLSFDAPSPAIRCALALRDSSLATGLELRIGLHIGEVVHQGGTLTGLAVHIGARVAAAAQPGEVLVSQTIRDMVVGSRFTLTSRGSRELKGVPGTWELWAVDGSAPV